MSRNCSYEWNSQVTRTRTELVSMWTATNTCISCLLEPVYSYLDSYSYAQYECKFETVTTKPNISRGVVRLLVKLHDEWLLSTSVYWWTQQRTSSTLHRRRWHNQPGTPTNHTTAHASEHPITRHRLLHICIITCASRHTDGHCSYVQ